jgi:hypothetical protein
MSQGNRGDYLDIEYASCDGRNCQACRNLHPWRHKRGPLPPRCLLCGRFTSYFYGLNGWAGLLASHAYLGFCACERCVLSLVAAAGLPGPPWPSSEGPLA